MVERKENLERICMQSQMRATPRRWYSSLRGSVGLKINDVRICIDFYTSSRHFFQNGISQFKIPKKLDTTRNHLTNLRGLPSQVRTVKEHPYVRVAACGFWWLPGSNTYKQVNNLVLPSISCRFIFRVWGYTVSFYRKERTHCWLATVCRTKHRTWWITTWVPATVLVYCTYDTNSIWDKNQKRDRKQR